MSYKTITVCLNEIAALDQLLEMVRKLAIEHDAHVKGLYVIPAIQVYSDAGAGMAPLVNDAIKLYFEDQLPTVRQKFEAVMKENGLSFDFQSVCSDLPNIASQTIENGRASDLIVLAARDPAESGNIERDFVERVVMGVGRPVLVVPRNGKFNVNTDEALVAWDNSREAARTVFDSLPLLAKTSLVHVVSIADHLDGNILGAPIAEVLNRHGLTVELARVSSDGMGAGAALLRAANDYGVGLIIMGCYGHGRFSELVFGGATRHVLAHLDRPALMSH